MRHVINFAYFGSAEHIDDEDLKDILTFLNSFISTFCVGVIHFIFFG